MTQTPTWTDGVDGVPYLWSSRQSAVTAKNTMCQRGIPCRTVYIESNVYAVERKSDELMVSQDGVLTLDLNH